MTGRNDHLSGKKQGRSTRKKIKGKRGKGVDMFNRRATGLGQEKTNATARDLGDWRVITLWN